MIMWRSLILELLVGLRPLGMRLEMLKKGVEEPRLTYRALFRSLLMIRELSGAQLALERERERGRERERFSFLQATMVVPYADKQDQTLQIEVPAVYSLRRTSARVKTLAEAKHSNGSPSPAIKRRATSSPKLKKVGKKRKIEMPAPVVCDTVVEKGTHAKVTDTLRIFNKHYLHFIQKEEKRCGGLKADRKRKIAKCSTSKKKDIAKNSTKKLSKRPDLKAITGKKDIAKDSTKKRSKRPDLKAISKMIKIKATLYPEKRLGSIPGIDVGCQFFSRAEMVVIGFHDHWLNGINYIGETGAKSAKTLDLKGCTFPLALSIVLSGQYEDDLDNSEDIVYTGQGGNNLLGNKRQISDQVLKRGNLALKNSMEQALPVRVIRGHKCQNSYVGKVYTYDGLYRVVKYWAEKGVSGYTVYKFRLKRLEGQPPLTTKEVYFTRGRIPQSISEIRGLVCEDITGGLEAIPIPVTNLVDDPPISPEGFVYINNMKFSKNTKVEKIAPAGCNCEGMCTDPRSCGCAKLNGGDFPYVHRNGGRLVEPKGVVFECGPNCGCGPKCVNKTSQNGIRFRLEVFRTSKKGWGVRSWDYIPSGAPICEYIGLLRRTSDLNPAADNSYVFDIDCLQTMKGLEGRESRLRDVCLPSHLQKAGEEVTESVPFCIDAAHTGNIARFINHSCQPNLFVQCMLSDHHDLKLARVMLVAADNIPPLKELTYDYGYALDSVIGPDGKIRQMSCFCGADECRKRLY